MSEGWPVHTVLALLLDATVAATRFIRRRSDAIVEDNLACHPVRLHHRGHVGFYGSTPGNHLEHRLDTESGKVKKSLVCKGLVPGRHETERLPKMGRCRCWDSSG